MAAVMKERPMNGAERRKLNRVLARAVGLALIQKGDPRFSRLDPELEPVKHIMERWAVSIGDGLGDEPWDESRKSCVSPLDDHTALIVDQIVNHAPVRYRTLARLWFCGAGTTTDLAERMGVSRSGLYLELRCTLFHFRAKFLESKHADLIDLLSRLD